MRNPITGVSLNPREFLGEGFHVGGRGRVESKETHLGQPRTCLQERCNCGASLRVPAVPLLGHSNNTLLVVLRTDGVPEVSIDALHGA